MENDAMVYTENSKKSRINKRIWQVCCVKKNNLQKAILFFLIFLMFIYFWETERDRVGMGEGQRVRETQNLKQAAGFELPAQSLTRGPNPQTVKSWPQQQADTRPTEPTRRPKLVLYSFNMDKLVHAHACITQTFTLTSVNLQKTNRPI